MESDLDIKQQLAIEVVGASNNGQRVDNFLLSRLKGVPRSLLYKLIRKGRVRVNGKRTKPVYKLQLGDKVRIPPLRVATRNASDIPDYWLRVFAGRIIYEDEQLVVIDKPAGISVHRGSGVEWGVIDVLKAMRTDAGNWSLVHRLDRDTSGCLLIAKNRQALLQVQDLFRSRSINKHYLALSCGRWPDETHIIEAPLLKNTLQSGERMVVVDTAGKPAISHFYPIERYADASLVRVSIETGRTHQIRVHAQYGGHPLAGDTRYGDKSFNQSVRQRGLKRLFLHASTLEFEYHQRISVECPLPEELLGFLAVLKI